MDAKRILALYDRERQEIEIFGLQREVAGSIVRHISPDGSGLILYSDLNAATAEQAIGEQLSHFEALGRDLAWIVYQHDRPHDLRDRLLAQGFEADDPEAILALDLRQVSPLLPQPIGHDVRRIDAPEGLDVIIIHQRVWNSSL